MVRAVAALSPGREVITAEDPLRTLCIPADEDKGEGEGRAVYDVESSGRGPSDEEWELRRLAQDTAYGRASSPSGPMDSQSSSSVMSESSGAWIMGMGRRR